jgi:predicted acylesterase/phospholipase RssA
VRFRTYPSSRATDINPKIWEAARATSAATSFFDPITIGQYGQEFVDGATGFNNPVECVLDEAQDLWEDALERIQYIISIGTGEPYVKAFGKNLVDIGKTLIRISTDAEETARRFARSHRGRFAGVNGEPYRYQRFNVTKGLEDIKLEEAEKIKETASATERYMELDEQFCRAQNSERIFAVLKLRI